MLYLYFNHTVTARRRQPSDTRKIFIKYCIVGWGLPAVIVGLCSVLDHTRTFHIGYGLYEGAIKLICFEMASLKIDSYYPSWPRTVPLNIQRDFYVPTMFSWLLNFDTFFARITAGIYMTNIHIIIITMISFKTIKKSYKKFYWKYQKKYWFKDMTLCILCLLISQFFPKTPPGLNFLFDFFFKGNLVYCWISDSKALTFAMVIPVSATLVFNIVCFTKNIYVIHHLQMVCILYCKTWQFYW